MRVLIRVDASKQIGMGHIVRCLEIAKQLKKRNYKIYFAVKENLAIHLLKQENFKVFEYKTNYAKWIEDIIDTKKINIFIGDIRDNFPISTIKKLKEKKVLTIAIDEPSEYAKECDICFYPPHSKIDFSQYKGKVYQGFEYVVLREQFYKKYKKINNKTPKLLVMMGGSDKYNLTLPILKKIKSKFEISVIINQTHPDYLKIKKLNVKIYSNIQNMAKFLRKIDFAIISFGMSAYEMIAMQIPSIHICLDKDHYQASKWFEKNGYAIRYKKEDIKNIELNFSTFKQIFVTNYIYDVIKNHNKYFVSIGAGKSQFPLINELKKMGYKVIATDKDNNAFSKNLCDVFYNISTYDSSSTIKLLKNIKISGILTRATGEPTITTAKVAKRFNLKALDVKNAKLFSNKFLLIKKLNKLKIPSPKLFTKKVKFPVFVKPSKTVLSHTAMDTCYNKSQLKKAIKQAKKISDTNKVNIEEYLIGRDIVSIDFVSNNKIIHITTIGEISTESPYFDGIGWYSVSNNDDKTAKNIFKQMKKKLDIKNGFFQTAMKIDKNNNAKIYEVHTEIGGDRTSDIFIPYMLDYNIFEQNIRFATNQTINLPPKKPKKIIMLFESKVKQYNISTKGYIKIEDTYIKEFNTYKSLKNELLKLKKYFKNKVNK